MHPLIKIVWIILIGIILVSIRRILNEKGWRIGNFIRIEDDGEDNQNEQFLKRFLPLFILTGLLFGQDVLTLKNGESFEGAFYGKVGENIVFKVEGETSTKKYSIWDVASIKTVNNEYFYPFDDPNMKSTEYKEWDYVSPLYASVDTLLIEIDEDYVTPLEPVLKPVMYGTITVVGVIFILRLLLIEFIEISATP